MFKHLLTWFALLYCADYVYAQKVTLDYYFNHEVNKTVNGGIERYHYLWTDKASTGFSIWGDIFMDLGASLDTLGEAPSTQNLHHTAVYIIADPDSEKENPHPNYITQKDAGVISAWVKNGGVLVLMANDSANTDLSHFNILAEKFGLHFNNDLQNHVADDNHFNDGAVVAVNNPVFATGRKLFIKDACSISAPGHATTLLRSNNGTALAVILKYGKGTVFAIGDPWLYNEYTNGRLPDGFQNEKAAKELNAWLLRQVHSNN